MTISVGMWSLGFLTGRGEVWQSIVIVLLIYIGIVLEYKNSINKLIDKLDSDQYVNENDLIKTNIII